MKYFSDRLKNARKINGFSLQDLSDKLGNGLSKQAINRLETGELKPDSEILSQLCVALNVTLDYFFKDISVTLDKIEFRKLKKLSIKEQDKVTFSTIEYLERYFELENLLGIKVGLPFSPKNFKINSFEDIEEAALKMRLDILKIGNDPIYNIYEMLEENNIKVFKTIADISFSGMSTLIDNNVAIIVFNDNAEISIVRKRFTLLHELGHLFLDLSGFSEKEGEKYCDAFASAMLLPADKLIEYFGGKRVKVYTNELKLIKKYFGISLSAIMYRAKSIGLVSDSYFKFFMINYNRYYRNDEINGYSGKEESNRFIQLLMRAVAQEIITSTKAASLNNQKLADFRNEYLDNNIQ